jgi:hypothetical protein
MASDPPNTSGMVGGPPYGTRHYDPVQGNNALYSAIRAHEAMIRGGRETARGEAFGPGVQNYRNRAESPFAKAWVGRGGIGSYG